jgi:lipopolysaccharide transport system permease protein
MSHSSIPINPHAAQPTSLIALLKSLWRNRQLIVQMTKHEVVGRYKCSAMGLAWSLFNPVFMLVVYPFFFRVFYLVTAVPERFRSFIMANPLTFIIE